MNPEERISLINQLDESFLAMPTWVKAATKHAMGSPERHPKTGKLFISFREVIEAACDETLLTLRDDFEENGDLIKT
jgi:hypothetical protein